MTHRQIGIAKAILQALHDTDGGQLHEISIHADANLIFRTMIPLPEFKEVFGQLNALGCFIGVPSSKFNKDMLWSLTAKGEQTRQEMQ
jgi:hypothetical protein